MKSFSGSSFCLSTKSSKLCRCVRVLVLSLPSNVACGKNTALSHNEGILLGDEDVVIFDVVLVGKVVVSQIGDVYGIDVAVDFTVCEVVGLPVLDVLAVSVGTDISCIISMWCWWGRWW